MTVESNLPQFLGTIAKNAVSRLMAFASNDKKAITRCFAFEFRVEASFRYLFTPKRLRAEIMERESSCQKVFAPGNPAPGRVSPVSPGLLIAFRPLRLQK